MSDYYIANPVIGAPGPVTATHTSPQYPLGLEAVAIDRGTTNSTATSAGTSYGVNRGAVFVYAQGSNVASQGQFVSISNGSAVLLATANTASGAGLPLGVAAAAMNGSTCYGWVQVQGRADYARCTNHSFAAGVNVYGASTNGYIGSVFSSGWKVVGVHVPASLHSSLSAGSMTFDLNRPFIYNGPAST